VLQLLCCCVKT
jgi:serine protease AprX